MKRWVSIVALVVLVACYIAAGTPAVGLLFKPAVLSDALALKPISYHWTNRLDRTIPEAELMASRFYVLILAAVSAAAGIFAFRANATGRRFAFILSWSIVLLAILVYAQMRAFYTVG
ncbi:hypothetical protein C0Z18_27585 [Trinickia dabaoshanensis]|uniref:Uncharacterized protein n=1 Tax=Trinickia dabaoshanensis TaxID=564714 RepID=A0A2N7VDN8_9BURK|nr:hypothetical protein [Trinickia dabaoshanensis]PMS15255.1 hypothetical protein C0Z18_27585 [Trinickia dabaoshanensis]